MSSDSFAPGGLDLVDAQSRLAGRVRRVARTLRRGDGPVVPIVALAALLHSWALTSVGWGNAYYAAAVRSMTTSWKNFFFVSLDSKGFVSVDKPPLSLWVQAVSARIFGFSQSSILVPQAVAGTLSVLVLYLGVKSAWGRSAGLVAALCLALTPINVMVNHSNNTDSVLVLVMVSAAALGIRAAGNGRLRWFVLACAVAGTAMTAKMLAAVPIMPGVLLAYLWCAPRSWKVRVGHVAIGALVMAAAALWWFAAVDAWPKDSRPYVGSSATNSAFQLAFERNGVNQVDGTQGLGGGRAPAGGARGPGGGAPGGFRGGPGGGGGGFRGGGPGGGGPGGIPQLGFQGGQPGVLRLFNEALGSQIAWTLPLALVGSIAALLITSLRGSKKLSALIIFGGWFAAGGSIFSITKGIVHPYYMANIGPPIAGLTGIGLVSLLLLVRRWRLIGALTFAAAVGATAFAQSTILGRASFDGWRPWLRPLAIGLVAAAALVAVVGAVARRRSMTLVGGAAVAMSVVVAPLMLVQSALAGTVSPQLPYASIQPTGSSIAGSLRPNGGFTYLAGDQKALVAYLRAHRGKATWSVAVQSAGQAETMIIEYGEPVMVLGGFIGSDPILTADQLRAKVVAGEVRYFLSGGGPGGGFGGGFGGFRGGAGAGGAGPVASPGLGGLLPMPANGASGAASPSGGLTGLLPPGAGAGNAAPSGNAAPGAGGGFGGFGGFGGGFGTSATSFVTTECKEVPQSEWLRGDAATGQTSFPGGPTSSSFTLYDCGTLAAA